jgi:GntR family transcriptional regulator/MocR family aminotransferase
VATGPEALLRIAPGPGTRTARLTAALRDAVHSGRLPPGTRVPATRALAQDLGVSRGVVVEAYDQLLAEGLLVARRGAGTSVAPAMVTPTLAVPTPPQPTPDGLGTPAITAPLRPGVPDLAAFPRRAWLHAYRTALAAAPDAYFGYSDPAGLPPLRAALAEYAGRVRAARCTPADIVVTGGVSQSIALLARALLAAGVRKIVVEDPGSAQTRAHVAAHGLAPVPVPVDADGLVTAALPTGAAAAGVGAVLVTPAHQYPTGVVLAPARRAELLAWARRHDALIVEDDYDAEFRYDREPVGCLQGSGPDVVALTTSVSKALAPGLRFGWLVVPPAWRTAVIEAKFRADLGEPTLQQLAFAELIGSGGYDRHLRRARLRYRRRRDALAGVLAERLPRARVTGVAAGLHLVVELSDLAGRADGLNLAGRADGLNLVGWADEAALVRAAHEAGLAPQGLTNSRVVSVGPPGLVLGYAAHPEPVLVRAAHRLADLVVGDSRVTR